MWQIFVQFRIQFKSRKKRCPGRFLAYKSTHRTHTCAGLFHPQPHMLEKTWNHFFTPKLQDPLAELTLHSIAWENPNNSTSLHPYLHISRPFSCLYCPRAGRPRVSNKVPYTHWGIMDFLHMKKVRPRKKVGNQISFQLEKRGRRWKKHAL